jgi:hypothetical protein
MINKFSNVEMMNICLKCNILWKDCNPSSCFPVNYPESSPTEWPCHICSTVNMGYPDCMSKVEYCYFKK